MNEPHRTSERARVAARSVLANVDSLEGLDADHRARVIALFDELCRGRLDWPGTQLAVDELRGLLGPARGLAARTVVSWLDDLCLVA